LRILIHEGHEDHEGWKVESEAIFMALAAFVDQEI